MATASAMDVSASEIRLILVGDVITIERPTSKCRVSGASDACCGSGVADEETTDRAAFDGCVASIVADGSVTTELWPKAADAHNIAKHAGAASQRDLRRFPVLE